MSADSGTSNTGTARELPFQKLKKKMGRPKKSLKDQIFDSLVEDVLTKDPFEVALSNKTPKKGPLVEPIGKKIPTVMQKKYWSRRKKVEAVGIQPPQQGSTDHVDVSTVGVKKSQSRLGFTVKETIDMILAGHKANLSTLSYGGLHLTYRPGPVAMLDQPKAISKTLGSQTPEQSSATGASIQGWNEKESRDSVEMMNLNLTNPAEHERAMIDRFREHHAEENASNEGEIS